MPNESIRLVVAVPSGDHVHMDFMKSMLALYGYCCMNGDLGKGDRLTSLEFLNSRGSLIQKQRDEQVVEAIAQGATHLLFVDSDMTFPKQTFHELYSHRKTIVAANCVLRKMPTCTTGRQKAEDAPGGGEVVISTIKKAEENRLEEVWRIGTGVMLIDLRKIKHLPRPFFYTRFNSEFNEHVGEDWCFCEKLEEAGIPRYVDHAVSMEIGHIGQQVFTHQIYLQQLRFEKKGEGNASG